TAEQVVSVNEILYVKVIDIDLERRRISLSLKQANEGVDPEGTDFDPALYGMAADYDEEGNYKYPEGFDPETNEWIEGYEEERAAWEQQYADAQARWEAHKEQFSRHMTEAAEAAATSPADTGAASYSSEDEETPVEDAGTLASDEALAALREKLTGN